MQELVLPWLSEPEANPNRLRGWLQGVGLPPVGYAEPPFLWILRALPTEGDELVPAETELAARAVPLLHEIPSMPTTPDRDDYLYNLFQLCAGLSCADQLAKPLYALYQAMHTQPADVWEFGARSAFRSALSENQQDARLESVWSAMLHGHAGGILPGSRYDAFDAVVLMPLSVETQGEPDWDAIGQALGIMADYLEPAPNRRIEFRSLQDRARRRYPGLPWDEELLRQADAHAWPEWAVECLPSLCLWLNGQTALVWHYMEACLPDHLEHKRVASLCRGTVYQMQLSVDASKYLLDEIRPEFEDWRRENPFPSLSSTRGQAAAAIDRLRAKSAAHPAAYHEKLVSVHKQIATA
jgi:hypothetical protein